jgi:ketosteroid isomerase-like protein
MDAFYAAWQEGKWAEFFALFADDFTFEFPAGPLGGRHVGAAAHEKAQAWRAQSQNLHLTRITETLRLCADGWATSCATTEGTRDGQPYRGSTAKYLHVQHGKIVEYREYIGGLP